MPNPRVMTKWEYHEEIAFHKVNPKARGAEKFETFVQLLNRMDIEGWEYVTDHVLSSTWQGKSKMVGPSYRRVIFRRPRT